VFHRQKAAKICPKAVDKGLGSHPFGKTDCKILIRSLERAQGRAGRLLLKKFCGKTKKIIKNILLFLRLCYTI
jgi:hypothetical protein